MARFTLVVRRDGKALLTCQDRLTDSMAAELRAAVDEWDDGDTPLLVIPECDVVQVVDIEIPLGEPAGVAS